MGENLRIDCLQMKTGVQLGKGDLMEDEKNKMDNGTGEGVTFSLLWHLARRPFLL